MKKFFVIGVLLSFLSLIAIMDFFSIGVTDEEKKLWQGITDGNMALVKEAVSEGANINDFKYRKYYEISSHGKKVKNPVLVATFRGEYLIAEYLVECGAEVNNEVDIVGRSMLQYAMEFSTHLSEKIIMAGADLGHTDKNGKDVIDSAIECVERNTIGDMYFSLIKHGVIPTEKNLENALNKLKIEKFGIIRNMLTNYNLESIDSVLRLAFEGDNIGLQEVYIQYSDRKTLSEIASAFCSEETVKLLFDENCVPIEMLKAAVLYNNYDVAEYLLTQCFEGETVSDRKLTYCAIKGNSKEMAELLTHNGVVLHKQDVVDGCIQYNRLNVLEYMLNNGLDINYETGAGSALYKAAIEGNVDAVNLLIELGADVNGNEYSVPLVGACGKGNLDIAQILINNGADINRESKFSDKGIPATPLSAAIQHGFIECVDFLIENGADINHKLSNGTVVKDLMSIYL